MRLFVIISLVMVAFAANSVLNRLALVGDETGPAAFALVRLCAGAVTLFILAKLRSGALPWTGEKRLWGVLSLVLYLLGFSFAYVSLDAGVGALLLFGGVQVTMFAGAVLGREAIPLQRWIGAAIAFAGLVVLLWPGGTLAPPLGGAVLMATAAVGWGIYTLLGRGVADPLGATAANFVLAVPFAIAAYAIFPDGLTMRGAGLAVLSGALTSGIGYAVWYSVLPEIPASVAAVAQLTVPIIATAGGLLLLGEPLTLRFVFATVLVLGGIMLSLRPRS